MTDTTTPPFAGFPGFPPAEMLDRMWSMMRLTPFGAAFPGGQPGAAQGFTPSLSMMSDMMAPLTNVEELDKRITDMRAVEQWLKLNLNMLQSAIQALEVQRATLATLRAFGAFAQSSMEQAAAAAKPSAPEQPKPAASPAAAATAAEEAEAGNGDATAGETSQGAAFDASSWWNLLQSQFNQIAQFALAQPGETAARETAATGEAPAAPQAADDEKEAVKRPAAAKRPPSASASTSASAGTAAKRASAARPAKKTVQPE